MAFISWTLSDSSIVVQTISNKVPQRRKVDIGEISQNMAYRHCAEHEPHVTFGVGAFTPEAEIGSNSSDGLENAFNPKDT